MPSIKQQYGVLIREHTDRMRARNYSQRYIRETAKSIRRSMKVLEQVGKLTMPLHFTMNPPIFLMRQIREQWRN